jgi:hypothetical protein
LTAYFADPREYSPFLAWDKYWGFSTQEDLDPGYETFFTLKLDVTKDATCPMKAVDDDSSDGKIDAIEIAGIVLVAFIAVACLAFSILFAQFRSSWIKGAATPAHSPNKDYGMSHGATHNQDDYHSDD